ncbi:MAG: hypothetical protein LJE85_01215 [Gammaproteobacteria bacterium]|nr:hypothetical protein [Gammaproteobacteria bacterium]
MGCHQLYQTGYEVDGYIKLDREELSRLEDGHNFVTVVRPTPGNQWAKYGQPGDTLGAREADNLRPLFNLKVVANFVSNGNWITVLQRLKEVA